MKKRRNVFQTSLSYVLEQHLLSLVYLKLILEIEEIARINRRRMSRVRRMPEFSKKFNDSYSNNETEDHQAIRT